MRKQTIVKINTEAKASIVELENGLYELAIIENGEISYKYMNDVERFRSMEDAEERVAEIVSYMIADEYDGTPEVDNLTIINACPYEIWITPEVKGGKVEYSLSTIHGARYDENGLDEAEANFQIRKTWKGLTNYIEKFGA